jgi:antitoxin component HigA of HigAB toxin-antitoxin module
MQVVVKTPPIRLEGEIPENLLDYLKKEFGNINVIQDDGSDDDELIDVFETDWFQNIKKEIQPVETIRFYRKMHGLSQGELGMKIGRFSRQYISNLENGHRPVSKAVAKRLSEVFTISVARFI